MPQGPKDCNPATPALRAGAVRAVLAKREYRHHYEVAGGVDFLGAVGDNDG